MDPRDDLKSVRLARFAYDDLAALADFRVDSGIRVVVSGDRVLARIPQQASAAVERLLAVRGVELFVENHAGMYRLGDRIPAFDIDWNEDHSIPLDQVLIPGFVRAELPASTEPEPAAFRLVPCVEPKPTTALICSIDTISSWADGSPTVAIERLRGAVSGRTAFVVATVGEPPAIVDAERYWGERLFIPLGSRPEPNFYEDILVSLLNLGDDRAIAYADGFERIPSSAIRPLTRASIRLARDASGSQSISSESRREKSHEQGAESERT